MSMFILGMNKSNLKYSSRNFVIDSAMVWFLNQTLFVDCLFLLPLYHQSTGTWIPLYHQSTDTWNTYIWRAKQNTPSKNKTGI